MSSQKIEFINQKGIRLAARLDIPEGEPIAYALAAHCFTGSKDILAMRTISQALQERGLAVLRFDFTGLGDSEGEFANSHFSSNIDDVRSAVEFLRKNYMPPSLMLGHSLGGTAVLAIAHEVPELKVVATIGSPFQPIHSTHFYSHLREDLEKNGQIEVQLAGRAFTITREFVQDLNRHRMTDALEKLQARTVIFHDPKDDVVEIENAGLIFKHAPHPKSFISLPDAGHMLKKQKDADFVAEILVAQIINAL